MDREASWAARISHAARIPAILRRQFHGRQHVFGDRTNGRQYDQWPLTQRAQLTTLSERRFDTFHFFHAATKHFPQVCLADGLDAFGHAGNSLAGKNPKNAGPGKCRQHFVQRGYPVVAAIFGGNLLS